MTVGSVPKVLIVEDDPDSLWLLAATFRLEGYTAICASGGEEAYMKALAERPDLIMTDLRMPGMSGLELIRLLKKGPALAQIPIVVMSATEQPQLDQAKTLGAVAVYQKPLEFDQILAYIAGVISANRAAASRRKAGINPKLAR